MGIILFISIALLATINACGGCGGNSPNIYKGNIWEQTKDYRNYRDPGNSEYKEHSKLKTNNRRNNRERYHDSYDWNYNDEDF